MAAPSSRLKRCQGGSACPSDALHSRRLRHIRAAACPSPFTCTPQIVEVRLPGTLETRQRSVRQLSGGERRRVALALALGFSELAAQRGRLRSNLVVLDEVMQHLDTEGCLRVAQLLKQVGPAAVGRAQGRAGRGVDRCRSCAPSALPRDPLPCLSSPPWPAPAAPLLLHSGGGPGAQPADPGL